RPGCDTAPCAPPRPRRPAAGRSPMRLPHALLALRTLTTWLGAVRAGNDAALGAFDEGHELGHHRIAAELGLDAGNGRAGSESRAIKEPEGVTPLPPARGIPSAPPHPDDVDAEGPGRKAVRHHEGWHVLGHLGAAAHIGVGADAHERMD